MIGGGLTAVDTATESLAYYPIQVEKFLARYETLAAEGGEAAVRASWNAEEREIAEEFLAHARAIRAEREAAQAEGRAAAHPRARARLGRRHHRLSPAPHRQPRYTLNHEEVEKALEEGVAFAEGLAPLRRRGRRHGHAQAIRMMRMAADAGGKLEETGEVVTFRRAASSLPPAPSPTPCSRARTRRTSCSTADISRPCDETAGRSSPSGSRSRKRRRCSFISSPTAASISAYGDLHASFAGNVVKAMASAKRAYPLVSRLLAGRPAVAGDDGRGLLRAPEVGLERARARGEAAGTRLSSSSCSRRRWPRGLGGRASSTVCRISRPWRPTPAIRRLRWKASPLTLRRSMRNAASSRSCCEEGGSSALAPLLKPGEPLALMGPNGTPASLPEAGAVLLAGSGFGEAGPSPARAAPPSGTASRRSSSPAMPAPMSASR